MTKRKFAQFVGSGGRSTGRGVAQFHPLRNRLIPRARQFWGSRVHSTTSAMGDTDMGSGGKAKGQPKTHEAQMVPGLGPLEWGFPNSIITTLRYCDISRKTITDGATTSSLYRANGLYDPDYTNTGHQPMYRDTWADIYDYYTVLGSKITVHFKNQSATINAVVGLQGSDTASLTSEVTSWMEQNNGVHAMLGNINTEGVTLTMTYSPAENLGADMKDDQSSLVSTGSDPGSQQAYYFGILYAGVGNQSTDDLIIDYTVDIEYTVKFTTLTKKTGS